MIAYRVLNFAGVINRYDFIDNVIRHADRSKFAMLACTLRRESNIEAPRYESDGISHLVLDAPGRSRYPLATLRLARHLRRESVDLIHTHHFDEALIGVLAARLSSRTKAVVARHYHDEIYLLTRGLKQRAMVRLEAFAYRRAVALTTPSPRIKQFLVERQGIPAEKIFAIPLAFDFSAPRYRPCSEEEIQALRRALGVGDDFVVGNFGRHHLLKGQEYLLRAFAIFGREFPRARLLMVGDGPRHGALQALAQDLGVAPRVLFTGWRRDAARLMGLVDVVAHPSLHEAFSQMMVEALVHERPLIISEVAGPADYLENRRTAILIPPRDVEAIAEALRWVAKHLEEARQMAVAGREHVLREFSVERLIPAYQACYERAVRS